MFFLNNFFNKINSNLVWINIVWNNFKSDIYCLYYFKNIINYFQRNLPILYLIYCSKNYFCSLYIFFIEIIFFSRWIWTWVYCLIFVVLFLYFKFSLFNKVFYLFLSVLFLKYLFFRFLKFLFFKKNFWIKKYFAFFFVYIKILKFNFNIYFYFIFSKMYNNQGWDKYSGKRKNRIRVLVLGIGLINLIFSKYWYR